MATATDDNAEIRNLGAKLFEKSTCRHTSWKAMMLNDEVSANSIMKRVTKHYTIKINTR